MTTQEAIALMENEVTCIKRANKCGRDCGKCELVREDSELIEAFKMAISALKNEIELLEITTGDDVGNTVKEIHEQAVAIRKRISGLLDADLVKLSKQIKSDDLEKGNDMLNSRSKDAEYLRERGSDTISGICIGKTQKMNEFAAEVHENAVEHGWWENERSFTEIIALCHSELSEALEEYRSGRPNLYYPCRNGHVCVDDRPEENIHCGSRTYDPGDPNAPCEIKSKKPEGIAIELADCILRILDYCAFAGIDIDKILREKHEYNKSRPYKHSGKRC